MESNNIIAVFRYGSQLYGTANYGSDHDFVAIVKNKHDIRIDSEVIKIAKNALHLDVKKSIQIDVNAYTEDEFMTALNDMEISFLECVDNPNALIYGKLIPLPKIDLEKLRHSISKKASNSWVKAKKKLAPLSVDYAPKIGKKSAWHALRILMYGTQLAEHSCIHDYQCANSIYESIMSCDSWEEIDMQFRSVYNHLSTEFRKVAPK